MSNKAEELAKQRIQQHEEVGTLIPRFPVPLCTERSLVFKAETCNYQRDGKGSPFDEPFRRSA
jgi:hypothetical protein